MIISVILSPIYQENFLIVLKLFFILVAAWICELLTSALETEYGTAETCWYR